MVIFCQNCGHQNTQTSKFCQGCGGSIVSVSSTGALEPGVILDKRYEIKRIIKTGGMGAVYEAIDTRFPDEPCAVKELLNQTMDETEIDYMVKSFKKEAEILNKLRHSNLPVVKDYFIEHGRYYLVMDFIKGKDLDSVIDDYCLDGGVPEEKVIEWGIQILDALDYLHSQNPPIVYRDLKPANVIIRDSDQKAILIDFGIAREVKKGSQTIKTSVGTPVFAAEELFGGMPEPRSDIYSLGGTLHCLLTCNIPYVPFAFRPLRTIKPSISKGLDKVIMKALSQKAHDRFATAKEMKEALENLSSSKSILEEAEELYRDEKERSDMAAEFVSEKIKTTLLESKVEAGKSRNNLNFIVRIVLAVLFAIIMFSIFVGPSINLNLAKTAYDEKKFDRALHYYKEVLKIDKNNKKALKGIAKVIEQDNTLCGKLENIKDTLLNNINSKEDLSDDITKLFITMGNYYYDTKRHEDAQAFWEKAIKYQLGILKASMKNDKPGSGEKSLFILNLFPEEDVKFKFELADIYIKNKDIKSAIAILDTINPSPEKKKFISEHSKELSGYIKKEKID